MASVVVNGDTSGAVTLTAPAVAGTVTVTLPSTSGTMASLASVTANGVTYVNSSSQPTSGSALVFDGTKLGIASGNIDVVSPNFSGAPLISARFNSSNDRMGFGIGNSNGFPFLGYNVNNATSSDSGTFDRNGYATRLRLDNGKFQFETSSASGTAGNAITFNTPMTLDVSGNLGIGTTTPASFGAICTRRGISVAGITGSVSGSFSDGANDTLSISHDSSLSRLTFAALTFNTGTTERARIDTSGNLLVGTTTTNGRLSIDSAGTTSATYIIFGRNSAASNKFTVRSDGAGFLDSAAWTYGSDATIKENIEYLESSNCLSLLLNAKPAKFDYIEGQKANYGYIAQDVQKWLPEAVSETPNGKLGLQDGFINAIGTGAIQALHQLIQKQQALITQLQADVALLKGVA